MSTPQEKAKRAPMQSQTEAIGTEPQQQNKRHPLPDKGGFGPAGGREQEKALRGGAKQRDEVQREQSRQAWDAKYGPEKARAP